VTRVFDVLFAFFGLLFLLPVLLLLWLVGWFDNRSPLFRQERVGRHQMPFVLVKFRTMRPETASVATHLADASAVTDFGRFLRRTKLDELPQLWNVLRGEMSLVGPRPCLFNQKELISARASRGVFDARPGITGLAQVQGIDMSTPELLAETDAKMLSAFGLRDYFRFIALTLLGKGAGDRVRG
jgi:O-antigen biosynthesis protein WbqP